MNQDHQWNVFHLKRIWILLLLLPYIKWGRALLYYSMYACGWAHVRLCTRGYVYEILGNNVEISPCLKKNPQVLTSHWFYILTHTFHNFIHSSMMSYLEEKGPWNSCICLSNQILKLCLFEFLVWFVVDSWFY